MNNSFNLYISNLPFYTSLSLSFTSSNPSPLKIPISPNSPNSTIYLPSLHPSLPSTINLRLFPSKNVLLKNCIFHEIDFSLPFSTYHTLIYDHFQPFLLKRLKCEDTFCNVMTHLKLNTLTLKILNRAIESPVHLNCYKNEDKMIILSILKGKYRKDQSYENIEYLNLHLKLYFILTDLAFFFKKIDEVNISLMSYEERTYFFVKVIEYCKKMKWERKEVFYRFYVYLKLDKNVDLGMGDYLLKNKIKGVNWNDRFHGTTNIDIRVEIRSIVRRKEKGIYIPDKFRFDNKIQFVDKVEVFSNIMIEVEYMVSDGGVRVPVYNMFKGSMYLYLDESINVRKVVGRVNGNTVDVEINYDLIKI